jgi:hypothetical protein
VSTYVDPADLARMLTDMDTWRAQQHSLREADQRAAQRRADGVASLRGHLPDNDPVFGATAPGVAPTGAATVDRDMSRQAAYARLSAGGSRDGIPDALLADWDRTIALLG